MDSVAVHAGRGELPINIGIKRLFSLVQLLIKKGVQALYPSTEIIREDQVACQLLQTAISDRMDRHVLFDWMRPPSSPRRERR